MNKVITEKWQVRFNPSILGVIPHARKRGRGPWIDGRELPEHVRIFLEVAEGSRAMDRKVWPDVATVISKAEGIEWQTARRFNRAQGWIEVSHRVEVAPPIPKGSGRRIKNLKDLCRFFGADEPCDLNRTIFDNTSCGASLSLYLKDGTVLHNGAKGWTSREVVRNKRGAMTGTRTVSIPDTTPIKGFTVQTIIEGSEATVDSDLFWVPCPEKWVKEWMEEMEARATDLWHETHESDEV